MAEGRQHSFTPEASPLLLGSKLFMPAPRPNLVSRARLLRQLDEGLSARLVLVSGPAGSGKTTLLTEWLRTQPLRACWLSLDAADNDPALFLSYLISALQAVEPGLAGDLLAALRSPQPPAIDGVMPVLLNELSSVSDDVLLVLDDYHAITSSVVSAAVTFLLERMPPQIRLAIASRADPPLPLARFRSRGQMVEIRAEELRFTEGESAEFLGQTMGLTLSPQQVAALAERTEGWIAGLQMAGLSMRGRPDLEGFIATFAGSNRYILDFLIEEVLAREPEEVQDFLLRTSFLERFSGPLCDAVTGRNDGQTMLERLDRSNLFLVALDDQRRWYRYHRLFGDLLLSRFSGTQPETLRLLRSKAANWCRREGLTGDALGYLLAGGDYEEAAELAQQCQLEMHRRSDPGFFFKVAAMPEEVVRRRPWLSAFRAMLDIVWGRFEDAGRRLSDAESCLGSAIPTPDVRDLAPFLRVLRAYLSELQGRDSEMAEAAADALRVLAETKPSLRSSVAYWLALCQFLRGDLAAAEETWMRQIQEDTRTGATNAIASSAARIATIRMVQGHLQDAARLCRQWLRWVEERGSWRFFRAGHLSETLSEILRQWNSLEEALALVETGIQNSRGWRNAHTSAFGFVTRARVLLSMGRTGEALDTLHELNDMIAGFTLQPDVRSDLDACWVRLHLAMGDVPAAAMWVNEKLAERNELPGFRHERDALSLARVLLARGESSRALQLLVRLEGPARVGGRTGSLIEILTLQALAFQAQHETARALQALGQALTLAEPEGYGRAFVDEGEPMAELLAGLAARPARAEGGSFSSQYLDKLLAAFPAISGQQSAVSPRPSAPGQSAHRSSLITHHSLVEPLSDRELEVLRLVAEGLSNPAIAEKLIISVGTVKAHVHHIYGKLGVEGRVQAISRAQEMNLL